MKQHIVASPWPALFVAALAVHIRVFRSYVGLVLMDDFVMLGSENLKSRKFLISFRCSFLFL